MNDDTRGGAGTIASGETRAVAGGGYPVTLTIEHPAQSSRLYAVPIVGFVIRSVLLIPHLVALYAVALVASLMAIYAALSVLFTGRYPEAAHTWLAGTLGWGARVSAYYFGLTDQYPPFRLSNPDDPSYPVQFSVPLNESPKRFFAVPVIGLLARGVMLIPSMVVAYVVGYAAGVIYGIAWIPVLFTGRYPAGLHSFCVGMIRWNLRNYAYMYGLTEQYPPFQLGA